MLISLLSLSCQRVGHHAPVLTQLLHNLQIKEAAAMGRRRLERGQLRDASPMEEGALLGRALLVIGQEELASDVFHHQLKAYDAISRSTVRWHSALDQAWMFQHLHKPARAAACWALVSNDHDAPAPLRVEACCGLALSLQAQGQHASALVATQRALALCEAQDTSYLALHAEAIRLEVLARVELLHSEELSDHAFAESALEMGRDRTPGEALATELRHLESHSGTPPLLQARLGYLAGMLASHGAARQESVSIFSRWLRQHGLAGIEGEARVEGCLALLASRAVPAAREVIMPMAGGEREIEHHPLASDIQYCLSKIHMNEGRLGESLRQYKRHVAQAMRVVHHAALQRMDAGAGPQAGTSQDTVGLRLPPRYRAAYRYIIEHLHDPNLSVREIAGRLGVTERALQLAFRNHLGMTPAELIRRERVRRIEGEMEEASATGGRVHMLDVASRWGISNRSTLANAFKLSSMRH
ncbi:helix-turn-helix domain-containing protein [Acidovorax sp. NCPPB 4044]|uniref:helix-turn-helix domain-containing protein n=1 Tax=Acidovorax sp. NCPPB 4044 TaxID=2940490 RepID=UPI0023023899|nr:AraC family transcriptional regulator [Acidovorax sp. NCPPB 4044]